MGGCIYGFFTSNTYASPRVRRTRQLFHEAPSRSVIAGEPHTAYEPTPARPMIPEDKRPKPTL